MTDIVRIPAGEARVAAERAALVLRADSRIQLVYLFGSSADADRREVRDVDLAVSGEAI